MARPPKYSSDQIMDAVLHVLRGHRPDEVSVTAVSDVLGAPSGSIYHRFPSRDALLASVWLRAGEAFSRSFASALGGPDPIEGGLAAVRHQLEWARRRPAEARLFLLHGRAEVGNTAWPPHLLARATRLANELTDSVRTFAAKAPGVSFARARFALLDVPQASIRRAVASGSDLDSETQRLVEETVAALLARPEGLTRMAS